MTPIDQTFKDEVRARNDIVEVISAYVKLEQRGNRYVGLCPFHGEKTPSFHVIPHMQIYHCFGCKASGDVFKFVQEREHWGFYEALVHLAKRARLTLPREERTPEEEQAYRERRAMYDALDLAARFLHEQLYAESGKLGLEYLQRRGLTDETIRHFRLGWAPGYGQLYRALRGRFKPEILEKVGLVLRRRDGDGYMDAQFERVMFPITDLTGRVIGFGGRILNADGPKYKNTADTPLFTKRHVLFGLSQAKEEIRTRNQAILVEGYMDVIMPWQVGIKHVIAPLGTALTDEQCKLLHQQAQQVIVAFDTDTAGQMATLRGLEKLYDTGCDVRIMRLPDGKDPDDFIRTHGVEGFQRCVDEAMPLIEFKLKLALEANPATSPEAKAKALEAVARVLADAKNPVLQEEYARQVADKLASTASEVPDLKKAIDRQMNRLLGQSFQHNQLDSRNNIRESGMARPILPMPNSGQSPQPVPRTNTGQPRNATRADLAWKAERTLIFLLLNTPSLLSRITAELGEAPFTDPIHQTIYGAALTVCARGVPGGDPIVAKVFDQLADPDARLVVTEMAATPILSAKAEQEASDCIEKIKQHRDSRRIADLENHMKAKQAAGESVDAAVLQEYMTLQRKTKTGSKS